MKAISTLLFLLMETAVRLDAQPTTFYRGYSSAPMNNYPSVASALAEAGNGDFIGAYFWGPLFRTDAAGEPLWAYSYSLPGNSNAVRISRVVPLLGGDFVFVGTSPGSAMPFKPDTAVICRVDAAGDVVWAKTAAVPSTHSLEGRAAIRTANKELTVLLSQKASGIGNYTLAYRIDSAGNLVWRNIYLPAGSGPATRKFLASDIAECANEDLVFAGVSSAPYDEVVIRTNVAGTIAWARNIPPTYTPSYRTISRIREISGGAIRLTVNSAYTTHGPAYFTLDAGGAASGAGKAYKTSSGGSAILPSGDMLFGIDGYTSSAGSLFKVSNSGITDFAVTYSGTALPLNYRPNLQQLIQTSDGAYAGIGQRIIGGFPATGLMIKADANGQVQPFTQSSSVADTPYAVTSGPVSINDSLATIALVPITLNRSPVAMSDTLYAISTSVAGVGAKRALMLFPNPANDVVHFGLDNALDVEVFSGDGRMVLAKKGVRSLNVSALLPGPYLIRVKNEAGAVQAAGRLRKE